MRLSLAILLLVCIGVTGCGSKVTRKNLDKIKEGMTVDQVEDILGSPDDESPGATTVNFGPGSDGPLKTLIWRNGEASISVVFAAGRVNLVASEGL